MVELLSRTEKARTREAIQLLGTHALGGDSFRSALEALRHASGSRLLVAYSVEPRGTGDDLTISWGYCLGHDAAIPWLDAWMAGKGVRYGGWNSLRPEPSQRNQVLWDDEVLAVTGSDNRIQQELFPQLGIGGHRSVRAVLCERSSFVAYVSFVQPERPSARERAILVRAAPALRRRAVFERDLRIARHGVAALPTVLERIGAAAWVLDARGSVVVANTAGQQRLDREPSFARELRRRDPGASFARLPFEGRGARGEIVIDRHRSALPSFASFAARIGRAQALVGALMVERYGNAAIAAELAVAERTVEAHLTAIYDKAQVGSRAALQAAFLATHFRA